MKHYYFVSFLCDKNGRSVYMSLTFDRRGNRLRGNEDITEIIEHIKESQKADNVAILSITLLDSEKQHCKFIQYLLGRR